METNEAFERYEINAEFKSYYVVWKLQQEM